jgi:basic membrane lipoprotein Med (substrate-binding protein (PBP1-ABC) superfamily)
MALVKVYRFLPLLLLPFVVGCNASSDGTDAKGGAASTAGTDQMQVALLTPGPVSDAGWNALANQGLQAIAKDLGARTDAQEAKGTQIRDAMRAYAQENYSLVIGHGYEYNEPASEVAKDFPNTVFLTSSGGKTAPNLGAFRFALEEGFYLAGMMAASMSKTGKVGWVALGNIPSIDSTLAAFEAGAKAAKPTIQVLKQTIQDDKDVASAQRATEELANSGVDYVIHQANNAAQGVFNAAKAKGIHALGANWDQNSNESGAVVASAVIISEPAFVSVAREVKEKKFEGRVVIMGMKDGAIEFVINPAFESQVPDDVKKRLQDTAAGIKDGSIPVPMAKF